MSNQTRIEWKQIGPTVYSAKFSRFTLEAWYDRHRGWRWWVVGNRNTRIDGGFAPRPSAARTAAEEALSEFIAGQEANHRYEAELSARAAQ